MRKLTSKIVPLFMAAALSVTSVSAQDTSNPFGTYDNYTYTDGLASSQYLDVKANAGGTYSPVTMGQNVSLSGCASNVQNQTLSRVLCNAGVDLTNFAVRWQASLNDGNNVWTTITEVNGNSAGSQAVINALSYSAATGGGTAFATAGTYTVGLYIYMKSASTKYGFNPSVTFDSGPNSFTKSPAGDWKLYDADGALGGFSNASFQHTSLTVNAAPVSEPAAILLMLTGIGYIARRERRRKRSI